MFCRGWLSLIQAVIEKVDVRAVQTKYGQKFMHNYRLAGVPETYTHKFQLVQKPLFKVGDTVTFDADQETFKDRVSNVIRGDPILVGRKEGIPEDKPGESSMEDTEIRCQGTITNTEVRPVNTPNGETYFHNYVLDDQPKVYTLKWQTSKKPQYKIGDTITFDYKKENYKGRVTYCITTPLFKVSSISPEANDLSSLSPTMKKGTITNSDVRAVNTKNGTKYYFHNYVLDHEPQSYTLKWQTATKPHYHIGDVISFSFKEDKYKDVVCYEIDSPIILIKRKGSSSCMQWYEGSGFEMYISNAGRTVIGNESPKAGF